MKPTPENKELVAAEVLRLTSIGYISEDSLKAITGVCLRHFPGPDSVSEAVTHFVETCDKIPPAVAFVRFAGALATKVPVRAYCDVCQGTGWELRTMTFHTAWGVRDAEVAYRCRCCAVEGELVAPPIGPAGRSQPASSEQAQATIEEASA